MEKENKKEQKKSLFKKVLIGLGIGTSAAIAIVCALKARKAMKKKKAIEELANTMLKHGEWPFDKSPYIGMKYNE